MKPNIPFIVDSPNTIHQPVEFEASWENPTNIEANRFKKGWLSKYPRSQPNYFPLMVTSGYVKRDVVTPQDRKMIKSLYYEFFHAKYNYRKNVNYSSSESLFDITDFLPGFQNNSIMKVINGVNSLYKFIAQGSNHPFTTHKEKGWVTRIAYGEPKSGKFVRYQPQDRDRVVVKRMQDVVKFANGWHHTEAVTTLDTDRWHFKYELHEGDLTTLNRPDGKWSHPSGINNNYSNNNVTNCIFGYFPTKYGPQGDTLHQVRNIVDIDLRGTSAMNPWVVNLNGDEGLDIVRQFMIDSDNSHWTFNIYSGYIQFNKQFGFDLCMPLIINRGRGNEIVINFVGKLHWTLTGPNVDDDGSDPFQDSPKTKNYYRTTCSACLVVSTQPDDTKVAVFNPENWITPKHVPRIIHANGSITKEYNKPIIGGLKEVQDLRRMQGIHYPPVGGDKDAVDDLCYFQHYTPGSKAYIYYVMGMGSTSIRRGVWQTDFSDNGINERKGYLYIVYTNVTPGHFVTIYNHITGYHETRVVGSDGGVIFIDRGPLRLSAYPAGKGLAYSGNIWYSPGNEYNTRFDRTVGLHGWKILPNTPHGPNMGKNDMDIIYRELEGLDADIPIRNNYRDVENNIITLPLDERPGANDPNNHYIRTVATTFISGKFRRIVNNKAGAFIPNAKTNYRNDIENIPSDQIKVIKAALKLQRVVANRFTQAGVENQPIQMVAYSHANPPGQDGYYPLITANVKNPVANKNFIIATTSSQNFYTLRNERVKNNTGVIFQTQRHPSTAQDLNNVEMNDQNIQINITHPLTLLVESDENDAIISLFHIRGNNNTIEININAPIYFRHSSTGGRRGYTRGLNVRGRDNKIVVNVRAEVFLENRTGSGVNSCVFASVSAGTNMVNVIEYEQGNVFTFYPAQGNTNSLGRIEQENARGIWYLPWTNETNIADEQAYDDTVLDSYVDGWISDYTPSIQTVESVTHTREVKSSYTEPVYSRIFNGNVPHVNDRSTYLGTYRHTQYKFHYDIKTNAKNLKLQFIFSNLDGEAEWSKEVIASTDIEGRVQFNDFEKGKFVLQIREVAPNAPWSEPFTYDSGESESDVVKVG